MGQAIHNFIEDFQDMFVLKVNTLTSFPNSLSTIELKLIDDQLSDISNKLSLLSSLTKEASEENLKEYKEIIRILTSKLDYIEDLSDMLLYINSFYDMDNILDIKNYDLRSLTKNNNLIYDSEQKGLTLRGIANTFNCPKEISDGLSFTYYNTNLSYHSGIVLDSEYLGLLSIKSILVIKSDGTSLRLPLKDIDKKSYYIKHDFLSSTQVVVEFNVNVLALPLEQQEYYKSLKISLVDYEYINEGDLVLDVEEYNAKRLFNFIYNYELPSDCYMNMTLNLDLLDVNKNKISPVTLLLPLGSQHVCKRLDNLDIETVDNIVGIYINNKYKENKRNKITLDYLIGLENKNEIYVVYLKKIKEEDVLNNYLTVYNNQGILLKNKNIKGLRVFINIEMFTFNKNLSPVLKMLTGVTKT